MKSYHTTLDTYALPEPIINTMKFISTNETEVMLAVVIIASFLIGVVAQTIKSKLKKTEKEIETEEVNEPAEIDLTKGQLAIDYLERIISEKYNYYKYLELLPIYLDNKIPEKKVIKETKEKIYVSVVGSLTTEVKRELLKFFTEKGIEIFVHEKIIIHMNQTDFRASEKLTESFREITAGNVDKLM